MIDDNDQIKNFFSISREGASSYKQSGQKKLDNG